MTNLSSRDPKRLHLDGCTVAMTVAGFEIWKTATRATFDGIWKVVYVKGVQLELVGKGNFLVQFALGSLKNYN